MSKPNCVFRCDGNSQIGSGHLSRCLTLALALREKGASCRFICREHSLDMAASIVAQGFEMLFLAEKRGSPEADPPVLAHADWLGTDWYTDADQTIAALADIRPNWLIVDHYALDARWESTLRPYCGKIMVIDDLAERPHNCDILLDQNLVDNMQGRYEGLLPQDTAQLIGPSWALLQSDYAYWHPRTPPRTGPVKRILVYFGGADQQNLTGKTIAAFLALQKADIQLDVVINPSGTHTTAIQQQIKGYTNITLHGSLPSLAPLMLQTDLAIGAGGPTSWERCCMGLPALIITLAENQRPIAAALHEQGYLEWLGDQEAVSEAMITHKLGQWLLREDMEEISIKCRELVDGRGAEKVSDILLIDEATEVSIRKATVADALLLSDWYSKKIFFENLREPEKREIQVVTTLGGIFLGWIAFELTINDHWGIRQGWIPSVKNNSTLVTKILQAGILGLRRSRKGLIKLGNDKKSNKLAISICSDSNSWINEYIPELLLEWVMKGHKCTWVHDFRQLNYGDICFYLSYGHIVDNQTLLKFKNNLVVHESDLPKGKGWSPLTWQILEGKNRIPVTLIEAESEVDSGIIYNQEWLEFNKTELIDDLRAEQAKITQKLCNNFVQNYPKSLNAVKPQEGLSTFYKKRSPKDSKLDVEKSIADQFNLLRVVDNNRYPAWFEINGKKYELQIKEVII